EAGQLSYHSCLTHNEIVRKTYQSLVADNERTSEDVLHLKQSIANQTYLHQQKYIEHRNVLSHPINNIPLGKC
ncbi:MAG: hypothetical protein K0U68_00010, partial [Gammaproteobacteria bacterium]|nr:hypothetical protein [Gammaproteobacteria bacterium]